MSIPDAIYGRMRSQCATTSNSLARPMTKPIGISAYRLVDQVHHTLGRHRDDDPRRGWISGLDEQEGKRHPTIRGLRIGKQLNERKSNEPPNERLEWDQDGQYYHYLTKWMHALNCVSQVTGDPTYTRWAIELAKAAHARFTYAPPYGGRKRMYWKMSIDLTYPLVPSMGQHDPLDGFVTYSELQATAPRFFKESSPFDLKLEIADMAEICRGIRLATDDPLGIGGLLFDASRIAQLMIKGGLKNSSLLETVVDSALTRNGGLCERRLTGVSCRVSSGLSRTRAVYRAIGGRKPAERDRGEPRLIQPEEFLAADGLKTSWGMCRLEKRSNSSGWMARTGKPAPGSSTVRSIW